MHFANLIGKPITRGHTLDLEFLGVPTVNLSALDAAFSKQEVWEANKAFL